MNFYIWRDNIVGSLLGLSDATYQRLAWTGEIKSSDGSPDEMLVTLLDDWAFESFGLDHRENLNEFQLERIGSLMEAINRYRETEPDYDGNSQRVLSSDAWRNIIHAARDLYLALCPISID